MTTEQSWETIVCKNCKKPAAAHCEHHTHGCCRPAQCPGEGTYCLDDRHRFVMIQPPRPQIDRKEK